MAGGIKNIAASVHLRLLSKARESSRHFNELLQHFAIERFIYRLSKNPCVGRFILKGVLMFWGWSGPVSRLTMEIDHLGKIGNSLEVIVEALKDVCVMFAEVGGIIFQFRDGDGSKDHVGAEYEGWHVRFQGELKAALPPG